jgi:hypothetical protein
VCRKVKGWWVGKTKRKSSKCNSSSASCGIGTVDGGRHNETPTQPIKATLVTN